MQNFTYYNPTKIVFGKGEIGRLSKLIPADAKVLMTYGGGSIKKNGVYEQVMTALKKHAVAEFGGIEPNPTYETLMKAVELVKKEKISFLLSVGGGSALDGTKFIAVAVSYEGKDPWEILSQHAPVKKALPIGCVLTLPATGSESNGNSVVSRKSTDEKLYFNSPLVYPVLSILDPETTYSLPQKRVSNGIADAYVHVLEQYLTYPCETPLQDRQSEAVLKTLIEVAPQVVGGQKDYDSRATFMWAATQALNGLLSCGVVEDWATHMIGHELTAFYGIDHAESLVVVAPRLMERQRQGKREKLLQYAERVWDCRETDPDKKISMVIQKTEEFFYKTLGMRTRLSQYKISANEAAKKISQRFKERGTCLGERGDITPAVVEEIVKMCE